jgi:PII-like signaling protein
VDRPDRIERLLPILDEMVQEGMVTIEDIHVLKYVSGPSGEEMER